MSQSLPTGQLSNVPWRKSEVWYAANDIYVDLIEEVGAVLAGNWGWVVGGL
jgi:AP-3 complex subunit mu